MAFGTRYGEQENMFPSSGSGWNSNIRTSPYLGSDIYVGAALRKSPSESSIPSYATSSTNLQFSSHTSEKSSPNKSKLDENENLKKDNAPSVKEFSRIPEEGPTRPAYDVFRETERTIDNSDGLEKVFLQIMRLLFYIIIASIVFAGSVAGSICMLNMATHLKQSDEKHAVSITSKLLILLYVPLALEWLFKLLRVMFSKAEWPSLKEALVLNFLTSVTACGKSMLVFKVLPTVNIEMASLFTLSVFIIPCLLNVFDEFKILSRKREKLRCFFSIVLAVVALLVQLGAPVTTFVFGNLFIRSNATLAIYHVFEIEWSFSVESTMYCVAVLLISLTWWENFIHHDVRIGKLHIPFTHWRRRMKLLRNTSRILVIPCEMTIIFLTVLIPTRYPSLDSNLSDVWRQIFDDLWTMIKMLKTLSLSDGSISNESHLYLMLLVIISASLAVPYMSNLACKLHMQRLAFSLPVCLSPIVVYIIVDCQCSLDFLGKEYFIETILCGHRSDDETLYRRCLAGGLWLSYLIITSHIWTPRSERMATLDRLFITPLLDPIFNGINLAIRRRQDMYFGLSKDGKNKKNDDRSDDKSFDDDGNDIPMLYVCATMWHETETEMMQLMKSLFRMDSRVSAGRNLKRTLRARLDPTDVYDMEVHVIFDNAFETDEKSKQRVVNSWVKQLARIINKAASCVNRAAVKLKPPVEYITPYGKRLEYTLKGGTKMEVHLKDKDKIRHRKRWSQVLYMYYLLAFKFMNGRGSVQDVLQKKTRRVRPFASILNNLPPDVVKKADNTYIMALDGDVDFQPDSVKMLMDRLRKNRKVAAACGRIHPIGSGPMVWYQQFEYAIGHWLQKATEHVFGCVLCCPGCFSMFRASSLMDDNVMHAYTKEPTEARHYIQYEQGEDRWLCTLLLQQGYKIDYAAGADAFTFAPESFDEFFIQRRRWSPSTMANIMDLISSWKMTVQMNDNISVFFIFYQLVLIISSVLAPGTVVLMVAGSYSVVLGVEQWDAFLMSMSPVVFYIFICLLVESQDIQIKVAAFLSSIYALVMVIVTVGTVVDMVNSDLITPNVLFFAVLGAIFSISGLAHPKEIACLVHGLLYFITVPSTFIFLTIYFLCNLNIVTWGTREGPKKVDPNETIVIKKQSRIEKLMSFLRCTEFITEVIKKYSPRKAVNEKETEIPSVVVTPDTKTMSVVQDVCLEDVDAIETSGLKSLHSDEEIFWKDLIKRYLLPREENGDNQKKIKADLLSVRNNVVFGFFLINLMFIVIIVELEMKRDVLKNVYIAGEYEPVSVLFLSIFGAILSVQFIGMLRHRWGTLLHLISMTTLHLYCKRESSDDISSRAIKEAEELQRPNAVVDIPAADYGSDDEDDNLSFYTHSRQSEYYEDSESTYGTDQHETFNDPHPDYEMQTEPETDYDRAFQQNFNMVKPNARRRTDYRQFDTVRSLYQANRRYRDWPLRNVGPQYRV